MGRLNQYLFMKSALNIGGLIIFALVILCLERMLRIFEVVSSSVNPAGDATSMIVNLLPHYLGIAVPMALLLGIIITIDRFSRSSELTAAMGAGISLFHMTKPFMIIASFLAVITLFVEGYMQPVGRYNYRQVVHLVQQQSFAATLREGTFTKVGTRTFHAGTDKPGGAIGPIFIYEKLYKDGQADGLRITSAEEGQLIIREETGEPILQLSEGQTYQILPSRQLDGDFSFESSAIAGAATIQQFRMRGDDERELTSLELLSNRDGARFVNVSPEVNNAALHLRIGRAVLLLILPLIAVPFGLNYGRNPSSAGLFIGIVGIVSIQKALEFGQNLGANGVIAPWLGIWPTIGAVFIFALYIFWKSAFKMGQPPLTTITFYTQIMSEEIVRSLKQIRQTLVGQR